MFFHLAAGKDYVRVVTCGYQGAEFDAETLQFTSSCKPSDVKRGSFCTGRPVLSAEIPALSLVLSCEKLGACLSVGGPI